MKKFCLLWLYTSFLTFVRQRGHGHEHTPVSFLIDELSYLVGSSGVNADLLTADLDELINRIARSHRIWLTLASQELFQLPETIRQTVLSVGTVLFGQTSDEEAAQELAQRWYRYDPYLVKRREFSGGRPERLLPGGYREPAVPPAEHITWFTRDEQNYLASREFLDLAPLTFLIGQSRREGQLSTKLRRLDTAPLDPGQYPSREQTDWLRAQLMRRDGLPEQALLREIDGRLTTSHHPAPTAGKVPAGLVPPPQPAAPEVTTQAAAEKPPAGAGAGLPPMRPRSRKPPAREPA